MDVTLQSGTSDKSQYDINQYNQEKLQQCGSQSSGMQSKGVGQHVDGLTGPTDPNIEGGMQQRSWLQICQDDGTAKLKGADEGDCLVQQ
ncbi:hypothetical protein FOXB_15207 [Fusarium oxysporum f. sp. conglutinans Fo5176]|uniref:Uncharacterized protein n=1 Tax=Fusarium oxysporum (strain Fo5176) TaxID=660025 RepID=F9G975_FUSOF|nr:hypothetical protein FOXB_15207 [Fusarium oxysporum f. sp. conglutinans Fo5176]